MFYLPICLCAMHMPGSLWSQKRESDSLLELQAIVSHHVSAGNGTLVFLSTKSFSPAILSVGFWNSWSFKILLTFVVSIYTYSHICYILCLLLILYFISAWSYYLVLCLFLETLIYFMN